MSDEKSPFQHAPRGRLEAKTDELVDELNYALFGHQGGGLGEEVLQNTPTRFLKALEELLGGYALNPSELLAPVFQEVDTDQIVAISDIRFTSLCEHHMLPFHGRAHVAYVPSWRGVVGLSKIPRLVDAYARRFQLQERLGKQVADTMEEVLKPVGVAVVIEATHLCMCARGIRTPDAITRTSVVRGCFADPSKPEARQEVMTLLLRGGR